MKNDSIASCTKGYQESLKDSPAWAISYGVTEKLIKKFNIKTIAEIGVARGHHSAHLLEAIPDLKLFSIDPWGLFTKEHKAMYTYHSLEDDEKIYQKVKELLNPFGARSIIIRSTSERAIIEIKNLLDMIFIDADHTYESVKADLNLWWDKVKDNGIISGHDYDHPCHPGVTVAVNEFFENKNLKVTKEDGTVWWVQKNLSAQKSENKNIIKITLRKFKYLLLVFRINIIIFIKNCIKNAIYRTKKITKILLGKNIYNKLKDLTKTTSN